MNDGVPEIPSAKKFGGLQTSVAELRQKCASRSPILATNSRLLKLVSRRQTSATAPTSAANTVGGDHTSVRLLRKKCAIPPVASGATTSKFPGLPPRRWMNEGVPETPEAKTSGSLHCCVKGLRKKCASL